MRYFGWEPGRELRIGQDLGSPEIFFICESNISCDENAYVNDWLSVGDLVEILESRLARLEILRRLLHGFRLKGTKVRNLKYIVNDIQEYYL